MTLKMVSTYLIYEVTISPKKLFYREKKSIALYSSMRNLCEVYG